MKGCSSIFVGQCWVAQRAIVPIVPRGEPVINGALWNQMQVFTRTQQQPSVCLAPSLPVSANAVFGRGF